MKYTTVARAQQALDAAEIIKSYGSHALAFHTLQEGMQYFPLENEGFLAYQRLGGDVFVLGDPVCPQRLKRVLVKRFLDRQSSPTFVQISSSTADILSQHGYYINALGSESPLRLPYSPAGRARRDIRRMRNAALRSGVRVAELTGEARKVLADSSLVAGIRNGHSGVRFKNDLSFLARSSLAIESDDIRVFAAFAGREPVALSVFDPMYIQGTIIGYAEIIPRRKLHAPPGVRVLVLLEAMRQFAEEGCREVNLGLLPFHGVAKIDRSSPWKHSPATQAALRALYNHGSYFFNFKGLSFHKTRFDGELRPVYLATKSVVPILKLWKLYRLTTGHWLPTI